MLTWKDVIKFSLKGNPTPNKRVAKTEAECRAQLTPEIKLYGTERCHKTKYYKLFLDEKGVVYSFLDVETNDNFAEELRHLYENRKLNFPTITIGEKKLRNPTDKDLNKWLSKLK